MRVLGIETSCDETAVAVYDANRGLLAHCLYSQAAMHSAYGGVVPELASRDHVHKLLPLIEQVLTQAGLVAADIDGIAYTAGPGLAGALLVGAAVANGLALAWGKPLLAVHHMEGHLLAPLLEEPAPAFPFVALLVSGGHTQLMRVDGVGRYALLGESMDDAAGEAFDKTAKMMGLPYPGGPHLAALAQQGNTARFDFPRPMTDRPGLDFSFSGLKTFTMNTLNQHRDVHGHVEAQTLADIAAAFQEAVVDTLVIKCKRALQHTSLVRLVLAGGVSANTCLREKMAVMTHNLQAQVFYPRHEFCTDNGAMIAFAGCQRLLAGQHHPFELQAKARWPMTELQPI